MRLRMNDWTHWGRVRIWSVLLGSEPMCVSAPHEQWQCVTPWMLSLRLSARGFEEMNKRSHDSEVLALMTAVSFSSISRWLQTVFVCWVPLMENVLIWVTVQPQQLKGQRRRGTLDGQRVTERWRWIRGTDEGTWRQQEKGGERLVMWWRRDGNDTERSAESGCCVMVEVEMSIWWHVH